MKTYETMGNSGTRGQAADRFKPSCAAPRAARRPRLNRRQALILGAGLWAALFGLELVALPPWDGRARPPAPAPTAHLP